jgi:hypothetical protein
VALLAATVLTTGVASGLVGIARYGARRSMMVMIEAPPTRFRGAAHGDEIALTCPNCGAEVRVRRGDPTKTRKPYICTCGTELQPNPDQDGGDPTHWGLAGPRA